jgi:hypothetical protein
MVFEMRISKSRMAIMMQLALKPPIMAARVA